MMKKHFISLSLFIFLFIFSLSVVSCNKTDNEARKKQVIAYAYDSFVADWGAGPILEKLFEEKTGYDLVFVSCGDGAQVISKAIVERINPKSDVLIGIDNNQLKKATSLPILQAYKSPLMEEVIPQELYFDEKCTLTPYDWSNFTLIYDTSSNVPEPKSLTDLTKDVYKKKIILMDPRTSTPGLGFVAWTVGVFGEAYINYWYALKDNILTIAPGWDAGYGLFTSGEAPLVISYTTSAAYHVELDNNTRYKALIFNEGHSYQIEGAGITRNCKNLEGAKAFIDFIISEEAQNVIPLTQWMYPVNKNVKLPKSYDAAPKAKKNITVDNDELELAVNDIVMMLNNAE